MGLIAVSITLALSLHLKIINVNIFVLEVLFLVEMIDLNDRVIVPCPGGEARYFPDLGNQFYEIQV